MKKILMALVAATTLLSVSVSAKTEKQIRDENKAKAYKEKKAAEKAERKAKQDAKKAAKKK
jgi:sortase (surface protein transpeptidase)